MQSEEIMHIETVRIDDLATDGLQVRVELDERTIGKYAELMADGKSFKPIIVFRDPAQPESALYLADGFHRIAAAQRQGHDTIQIEVHDGTFNDALLYALSANAGHGLSLNDNDVANICRIAWENRRELIPDMTEESCHFVTKFAGICGISHPTARKHITKLKNESLSKIPVTVVENDGVKEISSDATVVTREHLEERNPKVRALLKQGIDRYGLPIPERILNAFRSKDPRGMIRTLGDVRKRLERAYLDGDPAFAAIGQDGIIALDNAIRRFRYGIPWCVCRACRGEGCASCAKRGFQTKFQYDHLPREYKAEEGTGNK